MPKPFFCNSTSHMRHLSSDSRLHSIPCDSDYSEDKSPINNLPKAYDKMRHTILKLKSSDTLKTYLPALRVPNAPIKIIPLNNDLIKEPQMKKINPKELSTLSPLVCANKLTKRRSVSVSLKVKNSALMTSQTEISLDQNSTMFFKGSEEIPRRQSEPVVINERLDTSLSDMLSTFTVKEENCLDKNTQVNFSKEKKEKEILNVRGTQMRLLNIGSGVSPGNIMNIRQGCISTSKTRPRIIHVPQTGVNKSRKMSPPKRSIFEQPNFHIAPQQKHVNLSELVKLFGASRKKVRLNQNDLFSMH